MSRLLREDEGFSLLSYQATFTMPPETAIVGKKCCPVRTSLTIKGAVQDDPPSTDRVRNTLELPSLKSSNTRYTPIASAAICGIVKARKVAPIADPDVTQYAGLTAFTFCDRLVPPLITLET